MQPVDYRYKIQNPLVFANCFSRPYFARKTLEGVFRRDILNIDTKNMEIVPITTVTGRETHVVFFHNVQFGGGIYSDVALCLDMSKEANFTARAIDRMLVSDKLDSLAYVVVFCDSLQTIKNKGAVMKFAMQDVVGNRLCDQRWEYFVCCRHGDGITSTFLNTLCRMLQGLSCNTDEFYIIEDTCTSIIAERNLDLGQVESPPEAPQQATEEPHQESEASECSAEVQNEASSAEDQSVLGGDSGANSAKNTVEQ